MQNSKVTLSGQIKFYLDKKLKVGLVFKYSGNETFLYQLKPSQRGGW
jgi:hypothetical protein